MEHLVSIEPHQLRPGMYVHLDLGWMDHPFPMSRFKIKSEDQVKTLCSLGLKAIRYCPEKSDVEPFPKGAPPVDQALSPNESTSEVPPKVSAEMAAMLAEKQQRRAVLEQQRAKIAECQKTIAASAKTMQAINKNIFTRPQESIQSASDMMNGFLETMLLGPDTVVYAINDKSGGEDIYNHSINVAILASLLAKEMQFSPEDIKMIGMGSIFHDIGMLQIPTRVTMKAEGLTAAERSLMQEHCAYGEKIAKEIGLPPAVVNIVAQHHEHLDGSGYPRKLKGEQISQFAQLVTIVEIYDELCNTPNPTNGQTPHVALSLLFSKYRAMLNPKMLQAFIRFMGVYPPGTVINLSNDLVGIVLSVTSSKSLKPTLMVYDPEIPKEDALLLDLETVPEVNITKAIRPALLPPEVFEYLAPSKRATYFFDSAKPK